MPTHPEPSQHRVREKGAGTPPHGSLVVGLDGREHDADALKLGSWLHAAFGYEIVLTHVNPPAPPGPGMVELESIQRREGRALLAAAARRIPERAESVLVDPSPVAVGLAKVARERCATFVVLGSSHRGTLGRIVPGGVASQLLTRAPCAIAVAPLAYTHSVGDPVGHVGLAYDATGESDVALTAAATAAGRLGVALHIYYAMHAISPDPGWDDYRRHMRDLAQGILDQGLEQLPAGLQVTTRVLEGDVAEVIAQGASEDDVGLLFAGSRGYGPLREALLGGVGGELLRTARCPLVIIPRGSRRTAVSEPLTGGSPRSSPTGGEL
jgi:nucleotide-binding universal stress UspA family protein